MQFGAHVSAGGGIDKAIDRVEAIGGDCVQVFTQSPRMWRPTNHKPEAVARFRERRAEANVGGVVCHALYLVNLAAPDAEVHRKSIATLIATLEAGDAIGADAVIFHVGSHLGAGFEAGLDRTVDALEQVLARCDGDTWLCMENSAGTGGTIGRSIGELQTLLERLDRHPRLGVCLDSCHLYASGYDVTDRAAVDELVREVDGAIGLDRLRALHINDSATPLGSNRDRHANILEGEIGEGLGVFLAHPAFQGLDAYLEVPGVDRSGVTADELRKVREVHARGLARV
ncbi:MAG TPA: deoxyribonuclease IV [Gaiellaceae bacterium]|nr:deoxyribonuclease IV [Gaiellaceae bacterium]